MAIKGIYFDLAGTLLVYGDMNAGWADWLTVFYTGFQKQGLNVSKDKFSRSCDGLFSRPVTSDESDNLSTYGRRIRALARDLEVEMTAAEITQLADRSLDAWMKFLHPDPACHHVLGNLQQKYSLALISNFDHASYIRALLQRQNLAQYFDTILISDETGSAKPAPAIFHTALEKTGLRPEEIVHVGDSADDVKGAKAAGIMPILIDRQTTGHTADYKSEPLMQPRQTWMSEDLKTIRGLSELLDLF